MSRDGLALALAYLLEAGRVERARDGSYWRTRPHRQRLACAWCSSPTRLRASIERWRHACCGPCSGEVACRVQPRGRA